MPNNTTCSFPNPAGLSLVSSFAMMRNKGLHPQAQVLQGKALSAPLLLLVEHDFTTGHRKSRVRDSLHGRTSVHPTPCAASARERPDRPPLHQTYHFCPHLETMANAPVPVLEQSPTTTSRPRHAAQTSAYPSELPPFTNEEGVLTTTSWTKN